MATYTLDQQIYSFSFSQNSAFGLSFSASGSQSAMQVMQAYVTQVSKDILTDTTIQGLIGSDWTPVWGPIAWAEVTNTPSVHADNTMGCFYSPSQQQFIVAIAGTNINSPYGWLTEDTDVKTQVYWSTVSPGSGFGAGSIAEGSATGLNVLLNSMTDDNGNGLMAALLAYTQNLRNNGTSSVSIAVTGHSLGGALAPTLALYMSDNRSQWDAFGATAISCLPTAGPSPGSSSWATYYEQSGISYNAQYNSIDVVPHAWQISFLADIPTLYVNNITPTDASPVNPIIGSLTAALSAYSRSTIFDLFEPYTQVTPFNMMTGTFDTTTDNTVTNQYSVSEIQAVLPDALQGYVQIFVNFARFVYQMVYQHTTAYDSLLNITDFIAEYDTILSKDKPATALALPSHADVIIKRFTGFDVKYFNSENISKLAALKR